MSISITLSLVPPMLCICQGVFGQELNKIAWHPDAVFAQSAIGEHTRSISGGLQWRWHRMVQLSEATHVSGYLEATFGRWKAQSDLGSDAHSWTNQISVIPSLRLATAPMQGWYADMGVGPSYLTPKFHSKEKSFSTRFQFRSHIGIGYQWGASTQHGYRNDLALRVEHFSNAGYATPNPGVNMFAFRYTHVFH